MHWEITNLGNGEIKKVDIRSISASSEASVDVKLNSVLFDADNKYLIQVNTVDDKGYSSKITELKISVVDNGGGGGSPLELGDLNHDNIVDESDVRDLLKYYNTSKKAMKGLGKRGGRLGGGVMNRMMGQFMNR